MVPILPRTGLPRMPLISSWHSCVHFVLGVYQTQADMSLLRQAYTSREDDLESMASHFELAENAVMLEEYRANVRYTQFTHSAQPDSIVGYQHDIY